MPSTTAGLTIVGEESIKEVLPEWIRVTPFLRSGYGCMHMKVEKYSLLSTHLG